MFGDRICSVTVAILFLLSSLAKTFQLGLSPSNLELPFDSRFVAILLIEFEIILAAWLFSGVMPAKAKIVAAISLTIFAIASLNMAIDGQESCGCFGAIKLPPIATFFMDCLLAFWLLSKWKNSSKQHENIGLGAICSLITLFVLIPLTIYFSIGPKTISVFEINANSDRVVFLEPKEWVGKQLPITSFVSDGIDVARGNWQLILIHHDCQYCRRLVGKIDSRAPSPYKTAIVEISKRKPEELKDINGLSVQVSQLNPKYNWFAETPIMINVIDGKVAKVLDRESISRLSIQVEH